MTDTPHPAAAVVADLAGLLAAEGDGVHWTLEPAGDLNANLVHLDPGGAVGDHLNHEVDVLVVVLAGSGIVLVGDGTPIEVRAHVVVHLPKGSPRRIDAGPDGLTYLTVHRRRGPLTIDRRPG